MLTKNIQKDRGLRKILYLTNSKGEFLFYCATQYIKLDMEIKIIQTK